MSDMEIFYGAIEECDLDIEPQDTDEFYDLEQEHGCHYVKVDDQLYKFYRVGDVDTYGFSLLFEPSDQTRFLVYWYNGGGSLHEVVEQMIRKKLK